MPDDEIEQLLGAYALDACDPDEAEAVARHLTECPRCRAEVAAHQEVAAVRGNLGGAAPEGLWDRIWQEIGSTAQHDLTSTAEGSTGSAAGSLAPPPPQLGAIDGGLSRVSSVAADRSDDSGLGSPAAERARKRWWRVAAAAGTVAAALALVVGVLATKVSNLDNQVSALNKAVVAGGVLGAEQAALADPVHESIQLQSSTGKWRAKLIVLPSGHAFIVPEEMPPISSSSTFQAWAVVHGKAVSLGVLGRSPAIQSLLLQPNMSAVLVNTEPLGGTSQPTTKPFLTGNLPTRL